MPSFLYVQIQKLGFSVKIGHTYAMKLGSISYQYLSYFELNRYIYPDIEPTLMRRNFRKQSVVSMNRAL